jgi:pimeloyl-ACP methyl ester carboxylesterase
MSTILDFEVPFDGMALKADHYVGRDSNRILYLHGAVAARGAATTCCAAPAAARAGQRVFRRHRPRRPAARSRNRRWPAARQAQAVLAARAVARAAGGVRLQHGRLQRHPADAAASVDALVLIVPGVYTPAAYEVPFGPDFSAVIRRERSWADSDAWDILSRFEGRLLVIHAEHDAVIPLEIPERLVAAATAPNRASCTSCAAPNITACGRCWKKPSRLRCGAEWWWER